MRALTAATWNVRAALPGATAAFTVIGRPTRQQAYYVCKIQRRLHPTWRVWVERV